jgi:hypothetical protein
MTRCAGESGCAVELHGFSFERRSVVLGRLHRAFAASGCCAIGYRRRGRQRIECSFEIELDAALELYCAILEAALELTEASHRALTGVCVLRAHQRILNGPARFVHVRLVTSFIGLEEDAELFEAMPAGR